MKKEAIPIADAPKILGQLQPSAASLSTLYTVPAATATAVSSIIVCNTTAVAGTFRISLAKAGAADAISQYMYYNLPINGNDTFVATIGITLAATDIIRCYSTNGNDLTFTVMGAEIT